MHDEMAFSVGACVRVEFQGDGGHGDEQAADQNNYRAVSEMNTTPLSHCTHESASISEISQVYSIVLYLTGARPPFGSSNTI